MGWAGRNLTDEQRASIARTLFNVESEEGAWLNGRCPFHDDKNPSFGYNFREDVFKCLAACTDSGDLIDLFCLVKGYPLQSREGFNEFRRAYASIIGPSGTLRETPGEQRRKAAAQERREERQTPQGPGNKEIPESVMEAMEKIPEGMMRALYQRRGWNREVLDRVGVRVLSHYRRKSNLYDVFPIKDRDRVAIPVRDDAGVLRNIRTYYPFGKPENAPAKIMSWGKGHGSAMLFPPASMLAPGTVILCEGEGDCLCALSQGLNAIAQTGKPDTWPKAHLDALKGRDIVIAYDADKAGEKYAEKAARNLMRAGCTVRIIQWPDYMGRQADGAWPDDHGEDLTDFFTRHGKGLPEFLALVDAARPVEGSAPAPAADGSFMQFFDAGVNGRVSFREPLLAAWLIENYKMVYHDKSGQLYRWDGTVYEPWSVEQLKKAAIDALGPEASASRVNAVSSLVMSMVSMPHGRDLDDWEDWASLQNGLLNLSTLEFRPHDPDSMATVKLGVRWHGETPPKPKRWLRMLAENIQTPEPIQQLQEFFGYCLTRDTRFAKALLMLGPGSDGKSLVIKILREIVGPKNCSAITLAGLEDQFQRAALFGKLLNVGAEVTTEAVQSEFFKNIVTGDSIQASFKHKDSFEFTPFCKLVYAMNKRPRVFDNSDGFFRRILPIQFKRQYLENDPAMDTDLGDKLMEEIDGIFAWAVTGLHRLREQKRFTTCEETAEFILNYRRYNNPVMAFVQDQCKLSEGFEADLKDLYKAYKQYCSEGGFKSVNRENFAEELQNATRKLKESAAVMVNRPRKADGTRPFIVSGIELKSEFTNSF